MIIRKLTILVLMTNFAAAFLITGGIAAGWGVTPDPGVDAAVEDTNQQARNISSERTSLSDSFSGGMIATVGKITQLDTTLFALPTMMEALGIPSWIVDFTTGPLYVAMMFDILSIIRGVVIE